MCDMVRLAAMRGVGDWNLAKMLRLAPDDDQHWYIRFDRERALRDISLNILDNAGFGRGTQLELVFKQANLGVEEYQMLVTMWGEPEVTLYCLREPAGNMASACRKWPHARLATIQANYLRSLSVFDRVGGRIFEYSDRLSKIQYIEFLAPTVLAADIEQFGPEIVFRGRQEHDLVSDEIWQAYHGFRARYRAEIYPAPENSVVDGPL